MLDAMRGKIENRGNLMIPEEIISQHYCNKLPLGFPENLVKGNSGLICTPQKEPTLITAHLPKVLDWLHDQEKPLVFEQVPCRIPVLLYDKEFSTEKLLFHYDGTPASANLIADFILLFSENIKGSKATIISPSFIPKSKQREEQEIIQLVSSATSETSFIKFNFNRIGDFWSYAVKNECTLLVTTKNYQAELAKVLFHFYKGGMWYDRLSFYISL